MRIVATISSDLLADNIDITSPLFSNPLTRFRNWCRHELSSANFIQRAALDARIRHRARNQFSGWQSSIEHLGGTKANIAAKPFKELLANPGSPSSESMEPASARLGNPAPLGRGRPICVLADSRVLIRRDENFTVSTHVSLDN